MYDRCRAIWGLCVNTHTYSICPDVLATVKWESFPRCMCPLAERKRLEVLTFMALATETVVGCSGLSLCNSKEVQTHAKCSENCSSKGLVLGLSLHECRLGGCDQQPSREFNIMDLEARLTGGNFHSERATKALFTQLSRELRSLGSTIVMALRSQEALESQSLAWTVSRE